MSMLCATCSKIFADNSLDTCAVLDRWSWKHATGKDDTRSDFEARSVAARQLHHPTAWSHWQAIAQGCPICSWFVIDSEHQEYSTLWWFKITDHVPGTPHEYCTLYLQGPSLTGEDSMALNLRGAPPYALPGDNIFGVSVTQFNRDLEMSEVLELSTLARRSLSRSRTDSPAVLQLVKAWLHYCTHSHSDCQRERAQLWYPTRLLEIGHDQARLIDCTNNQLTGPYATLSHCWGDSKTFRLDKHTAGKLRAGLPLAAFMPAFKDAMVVAFFLGFRYIWIDSYCIYQDSELDWKLESSAMGRIYMNSTLNIGAAVGVEASTSCFVDRPAAERDSFEVFWKASTDTRTRLYSVERDMLSKGKIAAAFFRQRLFSRGWIVQERILAPRMLYFSRTGIFWECPTLHLASEWFPHGSNDFGSITQCLPAGSIHRVASSWQRNDLLRGEGRRTNRDYLHHIFGQALEVYSGCSLTKPEKDKVVAFQGIAKVVSALSGSTCWNGFIDRMLPYSLLWQVKIPYEGIPINDEPMVASSWHWASSTLPVTMLYASSGLLRRSPGICNLALLPGHGPFVPDTAFSVKASLICIARVLSIASIEKAQTRGGALRLQSRSGGLLQAGSDEHCRNPAGIEWHVDRYEYLHDPESQAGKLFLLPVWSSYEYGGLRRDLTIIKPATISRRLLAVQRGETTCQSLYDTEIRHPHASSEHYDYQGLVVRKKNNGNYIRIGMYSGGRLPCAMELFEAMRLAKPQLLIID